MIAIHESIKILHDSVFNNLLSTFERFFVIPPSAQKNPGMQILKVYKDFNVTALNPLDLDSIKSLSLEIKESLDKKGFRFNVNTTIKDFEILTENISLSEQISKASFINAITSAVMNYENLISTLLRYFYNNNQDSIENEISINIKKLASFESIKDIQHAMIETQVESIMKLPFVDMHKKLSKGPYNVEYYNFYKNNINEIFSRRNSLVHNNAVVSGQYLQTSGNIFNLKKGDSLVPSSEYVVNAIDILLTQGLLMIISQWNKENHAEIDPNLIIDTNKSIERISFKLLTAEKWNHTFHIYKVLKDSDIFNDYSEIFMMNYLLSGKHIGDKDCLSKIKKYNYLSRELDFKIGYLGMVCNYDGIISLLNDKNNSFSKRCLNEWPIFSELRKKNPLKFNEILELAKDE